MSFLPWEPDAVVVVWPGAAPVALAVAIDTDLLRVDQRIAIQVVQRGIGGNEDFGRNHIVAAQVISRVARTVGATEIHIRNAVSFNHQFRIST